MFYWYIKIVEEPKHKNAPQHNSLILSKIHGHSEPIWKQTETARECVLVQSAQHYLPEGVLFTTQSFVYHYYSMAHHTLIPFKCTKIGGCSFVYKPEMPTFLFTLYLFCIFILLHCLAIPILCSYFAPLVSSCFLEASAEKWLRAVHHNTIHNMCAGTTMNHPQKMMIPSCSAASSCWSFRSFILFRKRILRLWRRENKFEFFAVGPLDGFFGCSFTQRNMIAHQSRTLACSFLSPKKCEAKAKVDKSYEQKKLGQEGTKTKKQE